MSKVRALLVTPRFLNGYGGVQRYLVNMVEKLAPQIAVLAPANVKQVSNSAYQVRELKQNFALPNKFALSEILAALKELDCQKVIFGSPWPYILLGPELAKRGIKYAAIVHGTETLLPLATPAFNKLWAKSLAAADKIFAVSKYTKHELTEFFENSDLEFPAIDLLRVRVDTNFYRPATAAKQTAMRKTLGIKADAPVVLYLGRLSARKGVNKLIDAWSKIQTGVPNAVLVIAGAGNHLPRLKLQAKSAGGRIIFTGKVSDDAAVTLYSMASVFVLPATTGWGGRDVEGLGIVLLEAQACETPVIAGRSGGTTEALINGKTGWLIDSAAESELESAIIKLLKDKKRAGAMGKAGRKFVVENFALKAAQQPLKKWLDSN